MTARPPNEPCPCYSPTHATYRRDPGQDQDVEDGEDDNNSDGTDDASFEMVSGHSGCPLLVQNLMVNDRGLNFSQKQHLEFLTLLASVLEPRLPKD